MNLSNKDTTYIVQKAIFEEQESMIKLDVLLSFHFPLILPKSQFNILLKIISYSLEAFDFFLIFESRSKCMQF